MKEIFKDVRNYKGIYQISNLGRVKSLKFGKEKILKPRDNNCGYLYYSLYKNNKPETKYIHNLLFESFNDYKLKSIECIHHIDGNSLNNDLENNLQLMTKSEHAKIHSEGEKNPKGILKFFDVIMIKKILDSDFYKVYKKITLQSIADFFKVKLITISDIKRNKNWKQVGMELCI